MNAQLGTDLAQALTLAVQVGCTLNVHGVTVTTAAYRRLEATARGGDGRARHRGRFW
jgi:predicted urease superfamily metal-dependent hydrolase